MQKLAIQINSQEIKKIKARTLIKRFTIVSLFLILIFFIISPIGHFAINGSTSINGFLFWVSKIEKPNKGELAAFNPPDGNLYPDDMWFGKYIIGVEGDIVTVDDDRNVFINNNKIGYAKPLSSGGKTLGVIKGGIIPKGYYFMWTSHVDSYDSRYTDIGLINEKDIFGKLYPIF